MQIGQVQKMIEDLPLDSLLLLEGILYLGGVKNSL